MLVQLSVMWHRWWVSGTAYVFQLETPFPFLPARDRNVSLEEEHQMTCKHEVKSMSVMMYIAKEY